MFQFLRPLRTRQTCSPRTARRTILYFRLERWNHWDSVWGIKQHVRFTTYVRHRPNTKYLAPSRPFLRDDIGCQEPFTWLRAMFPNVVRACNMVGGRCSTTLPYTSWKIFTPPRRIRVIGIFATKIETYPPVRSF